MTKNNDRAWIDDLLDKYYWIEVVSGWLLTMSILACIYFFYKDRNSQYGWISLYLSFGAGFILILYKHIIMLIVWLILWIKVKQGKLEPVNPINDAVKDYLSKKNSKIK